MRILLVKYSKHKFDWIEEAIYKWTLEASTTLKYNDKIINEKIYSCNKGEKHG